MTNGYSGLPITEEDVLDQVGPGWSSILRRLIPDLEALGWDGRVTQVKEKFGGLRFYTGACSKETYDAIHNRISQAEAESYRTCEECGAPGGSDPKKRPVGWIKTLCPACHDKRWEIKNGQT